MVTRDENNIIIVERYDVDSYYRITPVLLSMIGYAFNSGYLGSSIYLTLTYNSLTTEGLKSLFKREVASKFTIEQENTKVLRIKFLEIRDLLEDEGLAYRESLRLTPYFLLTGPREQRELFLKGLVLGSLSPNLLSSYNDSGQITLSLTSLDLIKSVARLLEEDSIPYLLDQSKVTLTLLDPSFNSYLLDQSSLQPYTIKTQTSLESFLNSQNGGI